MGADTDQITNDIKDLKAFIYNNDDLDYLDSVLNEFNIFTSLNIIKQELKHSDFLGWLLNPSETHGLGDFVLSLFLKRVIYKVESTGDRPTIFDVDKWNFDDAEVSREWRNIDILIRDDKNKFVCVIENKIQSSEHSNQLKRYKKIIDTEYKDYDKMYVYLTIYGDDPSVDDYIPFTYNEIEEIILNVLTNRESQLSNEIIIFIKHYRKMIARFIMTESEVQKICQDIYKRHKRALDLIFEHKPDVYLDIYNHLKDLIYKDDLLILEESSKQYIRFTSKKIDEIIPHNGMWQSNIKRLLLFQIENTERGLRIVLYIGPGDATTREKLVAIAKDNPDHFNSASRTAGDKWFMVYKKEWAKLNTYEDKLDEDLWMFLHNKLNGFKQKDLPGIEDAIVQKFD